MYLKIYPAIGHLAPFNRGIDSCDLCLRMFNLFFCGSFLRILSQPSLHHDSRKGGSYPPVELVGQIFSRFAGILLQLRPQFDGTRNDMAHSYRGIVLS